MRILQHHISRTCRALPVAGRLLLAFTLMSWLVVAGERVALAAPADGVCTVIPAVVSNLAPTLVTLRSGADDASNPISAHVAAEHPLVVRDPGGDGTARPNLRPVAATEQTTLGENIGFTMPPANIAGQFEVLTLAGEATSDCVSGTPNASGQRTASGVYDGLAIGQAEVLQLEAGAVSPLVLSVRGTSKGLPLRATTVVTLSTSRGQFATVNGEPITPSKVVQLTLSLSVVEGAAVGTVAWEPSAGERPGSAVMTATALQDGVSLFKAVTGNILAPPVPVTAPFSGTLPPAGQSSLLVTTKALPTTELAQALDAVGCLPLTLSILVNGVWEVFVPGAPGPVNEGFDQTLTADTPFVVRCG